MLLKLFVCLTFSLSFHSCFFNSSLQAFDFTSFWIYDDVAIDLEEDCQPFILEIKRLFLKDHEHAFNPGITRWQNKLILSFRIIPNPLLTFNSQIGLCLLDEDFNPGDPQILDTQDHRTIVPSRAEDARLITIGEKLYIIYSDNKEDYVSKCGFRVYVSELDFDGTQFVIVHTDCLKNFEGASPYLREKNWVPFDYQGNLLLSYSLMPHKVLRPLIGSDKCETYASSSQNIPWEYGELRGGTPAILDGDHYISFFHSSIDLLSVYSNKRSIAHYFMGAYIFSSKPPFEIQKVSPKPIIGHGFYKGDYYSPYWKSVRCVFPCGILVEEPYIYVSYGRQDHEMWIVKIDKQALLNSLVSSEQ